MVTATGEILDASCGAWICDSCGRRKQSEKRNRVRLGLDLALLADRRATLLHLTFGGCPELSRSQAALTRFIESLRRAPRGEERRYVEYAAALEFGKRKGRPHNHVVVLHDDFISVRRWRALAGGAGFGWVESQLVGAAQEDRENVAHYLTKDAPQTAVELRCGGVRRARPISFSRGWPAISR